MGGGVLHPDQFAEHVAAFRDRVHEEGYHHEESAAGQCYDASHAFAGHLANAGVTNHKVVEYHRPVEDWGDEDHSEENHFANVVKLGGKNHVVDWTARQFGERHSETGALRPYPHIQPESEFRKSEGWKRYRT